MNLWRLCRAEELGATIERAMSTLDEKGLAECAEWRWNAITPSASLTTPAARACNSVSRKIILDGP
jgi:hypothetical protein